jgi:stage II sporulation protein D
LLGGVVGAAAVAAEPKAFTSTFVARWNQSHGEYLIDIGEYLEAIEAFDTAIEMADVPEVRLEAQLQKATVLAVFLDAPEDAIRVYDEVIASAPRSAAAETATFQAGMVLFDDGQHGRAAEYFERYLREYPAGKSRGTAEFLLPRSRAQAAAAARVEPTAPPPPTRAAAAPTATLPIPQPPTATPRSVQAPPAAPPPATPTLLATAVLPRPTTPPMAPAVPAAARPDVPHREVGAVRVRVFKGQRKLRVDADRPLTVTPPHGGGSSIELTARGGLVLAGAGPGEREVNLRADGPLTLRGDRATRRYRGSLTVRAEGDTLVIINTVPMEDYLYGVVTKESVPSWPLEALKTQAIASRTYALYQVEHRRTRSYDMVDDEGSQVYGGIDGESAAGRRAVDETRGVVLVYRGRTVLAMFTANTGWHTGDPKFIFTQAVPYLNAVPDPYSPSEQLGRWTKTFSVAEVQRKLAQIGVKLGPIRSIEPRVSCPSGRIVRVAIEDDGGVREMRMRPTLGRALNLPEILLEVRREGDNFVFAGGGFGHGVGLSQWGAKHMAGKGFAAKDILAFYYQGAELTAPAP